jgi:chromosome segregation ATPase
MEDLRTQHRDAVRNADQAAKARREAEKELGNKQAEIDGLVKQLEEANTNNEFAAIDVEGTRAEIVQLQAKCRGFNADKIELERLRVANRDRQAVQDRLSRDAKHAKEGEADAKAKLVSLQSIANQATIDRINAENQRDEAVAKQAKSDAKQIEVRGNYNLVTAEVHMLRPENRKLKRDLEALKSGGNVVKREPRCSLGSEEDKVAIDLTMDEDED